MRGYKNFESSPHPGDLKHLVEIGYTENAINENGYVWLYKVRAKPVTESYATKEGGTITRQTGEIEWTAIKRTHDAQYQAVADEDENGFTAAKGATFLQSVYEPTFANNGT